MRMDFLPAETIKLIATLSKVAFIIIGCGIVTVNYFHMKEARKMEKRLSVELPRSVSLAISVQLGMSIIFAFALTVFLFIF